MDCDINGWMETNRKQAPPKNKIFFRPKIRQKSHHKMALEKLETIGDEMERDVSFKRLCFDKKENINTNSTQCSKVAGKITLLESNDDVSVMPSPELVTKPFNTGYVLK